MQDRGEQHKSTKAEVKSLNKLAPGEVPVPYDLKVFKQDTFDVVMKDVPPKDRDTFWNCLVKATLAVDKAFSERNVVDSVYRVFGRPTDPSSLDYAPDLLHILQINPQFAKLFNDTPESAADIVSIIKGEALDIWVCNGRIADDQSRDLLQRFLDFPEDLNILKLVRLAIENTFFYRIRTR